MGLEPPLVQFPQPPDNIPGNLDNLSRREQLMCSHPRRQQISHPNPHRIYEDWRLDAVRFWVTEWCLFYSLDVGALELVEGRIQRWEGGAWGEILVTAHQRMLWLYEYYLSILSQANYNYYHLWISIGKWKWTWNYLTSKSPTLSSVTPILPCNPRITPPPKKNQLLKTMP